MQTDIHNLRKYVTTNEKKHPEKNWFEVSQNSILYVFCYIIWTLLKLRGHNGLMRPFWPFFIAQAQKVGVLQVVVSDEDACNRNDKQSNPPSLIPSTYCH